LLYKGFASVKILYAVLCIYFPAVVTGKQQFFSVYEFNGYNVAEDGAFAAIFLVAEWFYQTLSRVVGKRIFPE